MSLEEWEASHQRKVNDIDSYNEFLPDAARMTGRTRGLINSIPEDGECVIIVWSHNYGKDIRSMIEQLRPKVDTSKIKFVPANGTPLWQLLELDGLRGMRGPVFVDNAIVDSSVRDALKYIQSFFHRPTEEERAMLSAIRALEEQANNLKIKLNDMRKIRK